jgi:hypothetical protein
MNYSDRSKRSKGRTRANDIASAEAILRNPNLTQEDRREWSDKLLEYRGESEKAAALRART